MWKASSAMATCRASASASEYTATQRMPMRWAVWIIRQAISPRFAMRILLNMLVALRNPVGAAFVQEGVQALLSLFAYPNVGDALCGVVDHVLADHLVADGEYQIFGGFHGFRAI